MFDTQVTVIMYALSVIFLGAVINKAIHRKPEWILLLVMLSYIKGMILYLFQATAVFSFFSIGGTEIHLDDIVMFVCLFYCISRVVRSVRGKSCFVAALLIVMPFVFEILRALYVGSQNNLIFINDIRKFGYFTVIFYAVFLALRDVNFKEHGARFKKYIDNLMMITLIFVFIIWVLDMGFGINYLPGQINGTLSDGGSTFRVLNPMQTFTVAFYTLYNIYKDLTEKNRITIRTLLFIAMLVLLQWRTVIAAFLVGAALIVLLVFIKKGVSANIIIELSAIVIGALVFSIILDTDGNITAMVTNLFESFSSVKEGTGTFSTRTEVWRMMLEPLHEWDAALGIPFGKRLFIDWKNSAHSGYVDYIVKFGYVGLATLVSFLAYLVYKSLNKKNKDYLIAVFTIVFAVFWIGYGMSLEQGAILGAMLAILDHKERFIPIEDDDESDDDEEALQSEELTAEVK